MAIEPLLSGARNRREPLSYKEPRYDHYTAVTRPSRIEPRIKYFQASIGSAATGFDVLDEMAFFNYTRGLEMLANEEEQSAGRLRVHMQDFRHLFLATDYAKLITSSDKILLEVLARVKQDRLISHDLVP